MITPKAPADDEERKHWKRSWELLDGGVYRAEDFHAAELQQRGLASGVLKEVIFGGLEIAPALFHEKLDAFLPR